MFVLGWVVAGWFATAGTAPLPVTVAGHHVSVEQVTVNGYGPFRFLIDTGAQTSTISSRAAERLRLEPRYAVIRVTAGGEETVPAHIAAHVAVGPAVARDVELIEAPFAAAGRGDLDGILGMNFLGRFAWLLDRKAGTITFDLDRSLAPRLAGHRIAATFAADRLVVQARAGRRTASLVLDSGASHLVLFDRAALSSVRPARLESNGGTRPALMGRVARVELGGLVLRDVEAGWIDSRARDERGLLPLSLFDWIYADAASALIVVD